jgi:DNA-binding transcriptional ArsR family regulator
VNFWKELIECDGAIIPPEKAQRHEGTAANRAKLLLLLPTCIIIVNNIIVINNQREIGHMPPTNKPLKKVDLIIHPARFRILQALTGEALTTHEIAERLPDVPKSSIYRHLKLLLEGEVLAVGQTRLVNGIQEKAYRLTAVPHVSAEDVAGLSGEEHLNYFTVYLLTLLRGFADYVQRAEAKGPLDLYADRVGYSEAIFYASPEELEHMGEQLQEMLHTLRQNEPGNDRAKHKLAIISHPNE